MLIKLVLFLKRAKAYGLGPRIATPRERLRVLIRKKNCLSFLLRMAS